MWTAKWNPIKKKENSEDLLACKDPPLKDSLPEENKALEKILSLILKSKT
jgi:hypothetical protein